MTSVSTRMDERILRGCVDVITDVLSDMSDESEAWDTVKARYELPDSCRAHADALISSVPECCQAFVGLVLDDDETLENRVIASAAINYVLMPYDVIPQTDGALGSYSFLDDAILLHLAAGRIATDAPPPLRRLARQMQSHADAVLAHLPTDVREQIEQAWRAMEELTAVQTNERGTTP